MSNEINTRGTLNSKFPTLLNLSGNSNECMTKNEISAASVNKVIIRGNYGNTECPKLDDVVNNSTLLLLHGDTLTNQAAIRYSTSASNNISPDYYIYRFPHYSLSFNPDKYFGEFGIKCTSMASFSKITNNFTIEAFIDIISYPSSGTYYGLFSFGKGSYLIRINSFGQVELLSEYTIDLVKSTEVVPINQWFHIAFVRLAGLYTVYVNGKPYTSTNYGSFSNPSTFVIGSDNSSDKDSNVYSRFKGHMDEIRFSSVSRYFSTFTPPSSPFDGNS